MSLEKYLKYLRTDRLPHVWCPGCGNGIALKAIVGAIDELRLDPNKVAVVSGIGCSSRATGYLHFNTLHTLHGRAIAFATGVKLARPDIKVIVITGDGDLAAIGGNHFIHAARRNIDLTVVCFNNNIYGMTGGQYSPTTPRESYATNSPYGNFENAFDLSRMAIAAGASYVARSTTYHFLPTQNFVMRGLENSGFSFIEVITQCPTYLGRYAGIGGAPEMMLHFKEKALNLPKRKVTEEGKTEEENILNDPIVRLQEAQRNNPGRIIIGEFINQQKPGYLSEYQKIVQKAMSTQES
jgi:2-oxoglutarate ferredoxin oxidoreductase subunit beta